MESLTLHSPEKFKCIAGCEGSSEPELEKNRQVLRARVIRQKHEPGKNSSEFFEFRSDSSETRRNAYAYLPVVEVLINLSDHEDEKNRQVLRMQRGRKGVLVNYCLSVCEGSPPQGTCGVRRGK